MLESWFVSLRPSVLALFSSVIVISLFSMVFDRAKFKNLENNYLFEKLNMIIDSNKVDESGHIPD